MTGAHPDDTKISISIVNDKKMRLVERISLLDYNDLRELLEDHYRYEHPCNKDPCEICQIAVDFELV